MPAIALVGFRIKKLHVESKDPRLLVSSDKSDITFSWATAQEKDDPFVRVLTFGVKTKAALAQDRPIPEIEVLICGKFRLANDAPQNNLEEILLLNGSTILYGVLRGVLAGLSGAFSGGQLMLPTVDMVEIVQGIIKDQQTKSKPKRSGSRPSNTAGVSKAKKPKTTIVENKKAR